MPIGIALGGAALAAGGAVAAGALSAGAQKDAAHTAADTAAANTAANNALQREIYGENKAILSPYANNGIGPSNLLNDLLLGTHSYNAAAPATAAPATGGALTGYSGGSAAPAASPAVNMQRPALADYQGDIQGFADDMRTWRNQAPATGAPATGTPTPAAGGSSALSAWDQFKTGTNYQWRLGEGERALESQWAAHGALDSGAAGKAAIKFGQNFASNELSNYMNLLASQQAMGLSAAGAVAGVGTTYAGNVAAQNTAAANAAANAALASGNANAGMWGSVGSAAGQVGGALFQYGMGQQQPQMNWGQAYNSASSQPLPVNIDQGSLYVPGGFG